MTAHLVAAPTTLGFECSFGHPLTPETTGWDGDVKHCLTCVGMANEAYLRSDYAGGFLLSIVLNVRPFPTRDEVYGS